MITKDLNYKIRQSEAVNKELSIKNDCSLVEISNLNKQINNINEEHKTFIQYIEDEKNALINSKRELSEKLKQEIAHNMSN